MPWMIGLLFLLELVYPLPIKDNRGRHRGYPVATASLVAVNVLVHVLVVWVIPEVVADPAEMYLTYGVVPSAVFEQRGLRALSLVTAGFLHGDLLHLLGNMFILWFFGRKVEDLTGSIRFGLFYLLCLLGAGITSVVGRHALSSLEAAVPAIGASGAVSGVMAAYLFLFAGERIATVLLLNVPLAFFLPVSSSISAPIPIPFFALPAWVYIVYNFGRDLLLGLLTEEIVREYGFSPFGTDVFAHVGGLIAGLIFIYLYLMPDALVDRRRGR